MPSPLERIPQPWRGARAAPGLALAPCLALALCLALAPCGTHTLRAAPLQAAPASAAAADPPAVPPARGGAPDEAEIAAAVARLRADPNLGEEKTTRRLQWTPDAPPDIPAWLRSLAQWLADSFGALLWVLGGLALAGVLVWILRVLRSRVPFEDQSPASPSARSELDLRPASLPADIGAAARALLEEGKPREALSLLYRGALSRAVHRHGIAIEASATEGEALRAVRAGLDAERSDYVGEIVRGWQLLVYAGSGVPREAIDRLCGEFAARLDGGRELQPTI